VKNCVAKVQIGKPEKIQNLELTLNSKAYSVSLEITWKDHDCNVVINFQFLKERFSTSLKGRKDNDLLRLSWVKNESSLIKTTINPIQTGEKRVIMEVYLDYLIADPELIISINKIEAEILTKTQEADSQKTAELELSSQHREPSEKVIFSANVLSHQEIRDIAILISYFQMLNYVEVSYPLEMNLILAIMVYRKISESPVTFKNTCDGLSEVIENKLTLEKFSENIIKLFENAVNKIIIADVKFPSKHAEYANKFARAKHFIKVFAADKPTISKQVNKLIQDRKSLDSDQSGETPPPNSDQVEVSGDKKHDKITDPKNYLKTEFEKIADGRGFKFNLHKDLWLNSPESIALEDLNHKNSCLKAFLELLRISTNIDDAISKDSGAVLRGSRLRTGLERLYVHKQYGQLYSINLKGGNKGNRAYFCENGDRGFVLIQFSVHGLS
jgi:hypothetical protein